MVRARVLCLTPDSEAWKPVSAASSLKGTSWLRVAELTVNGFRHSSDFLAYSPG